MTQDEIIEMAKQVGLFEITKDGYEVFYPDNLQAFAKLVADKEREAIAQMFDHAPALVEFARNDQGGCIMCGFTPELAIASIRARGEA